MRLCKHCQKDISHRNYQAIYCDDVCKARYKCSQYYLRHKDKILERQSNHFKQNRAQYALRCIQRYNAKANRTPTWLSEFDCFFIEEFYDLAARRGLQVDHIIPLRGKLVSGLHVPNNLQMLSATDNKRKGNRYVIQ